MHLWLARRAGLPGNRLAQWAGKPGALANDDAFRTVRQAVLDALTHHMQVAGPHARITDRRRDLASNEQHQQDTAGF
ncbi:hypothetical protein ACIOMM_19730 [Streptomyces sp. NPDC087908]|uniref:hypothetical protein n=1 Tax=Streptomyces sp. NPDC087908 TaxID=3365820 RepID=UPI0037F316E6